MVQHPCVQKFKNSQVIKFTWYISLEKELFERNISSFKGHVENMK